MLYTSGLHSFSSPDDIPSTLEDLKPGERIAARSWAKNAISPSVGPSGLYSVPVLRGKLQRETGAFLTTSQLHELMAEAGYQYDERLQTFNVC